ncbi:hypothetical protein Hanom_Chr07g00604221 [Helianthus anomalus]
MVTMVVVADATAGDGGGSDVDILSGLQFGSAIRFGSVRVQSTASQVVNNSASTSFRGQTARFGLTRSTQPVNSVDPSNSVKWFDVSTREDSVKDL